jgi:hypothetical protein
MKPELSLPNINQEQLPVPVGYSAEHVVETSGSNFGIDKNAERFEKKAESGLLANDIVATAPLMTSVMSVPTVDEPTTISFAPAVAHDDDLIEKEWVDRAKKIVSDTHDDPHGREESVSKLQVDYLKKRYGRELGAAK